MPSCSASNTCSANAARRGRGIKAVQQQKLICSTDCQLSREREWMRAAEAMAGDAKQRHLEHCSDLRGASTVKTPDQGDRADTGTQWGNRGRKSG